MRITDLSKAGIGVAVAMLLAGSNANALVIAGPALAQNTANWTVTGLGFSASKNTTLVGFTYRNQGAADTVILTDSAANILYSLVTPAGTPSYVASISWSLVAGNDYYLLQTADSNSLFASFGAALPSNADITIINSGTFDNSIVGAISAPIFGVNVFWAAFNDIATAAIPEPATWALLIAGFGMTGMALRCRQAALAA